MIGYSLGNRFSSTGHTGSIFGISYNKLGTQVTIAGDETIRVWDDADGSLKQTVSTFAGVYAIGYSAERKWLAAGCSNGKLEICSTDSWQIEESVQCCCTVRYITGEAND